MTFRSRLLLLACVVFAPALGFLVYEVVDHRGAAKAEAVHDIGMLVETVRAEHHAVLAQGRQLGALLSRLGRIRTPRPGDCNALLAAIEPLYAPFSQIAVADREGQIYCSAIPLAQPTTAADREYFRDAIERREFTVSGPLVGRVSKRPVLVLATPILDRDGGDAVQGVIIVSLDLTRVNEALARFKFPPGSAIGMADDDGVVIARYPEPEKWTAQSVRDAPFFREMLGRGASGSFEEAGLDGVPRIFVFARYRTEGASGVIWAGVPADAVYGPIDAAFVRRAAFLALGVLAVVLVARLLGQRVLLDPLAGLSRAAERFGKGEFAVRSGLERGSGEMGELARTFDRMAAGIEGREKDLQRLNRLLTTLSEGNRAMLRSTGEADLLDRVCRLLVETGGYRLAWIGIAGRDGAGPLRSVAGHGFAEGRFDSAKSSWAEAECGRGPAGTAIREARACIARDVPVNSEYASCAALPLRSDGEVLGALNVYAAEADAFGEKEMKVLQELADDVGFGIGIHQLRARHADAEERIRYAATHDHLTALPNRALLLDRIEQALPAARRSERRAAVLALNLDRLKHVNESLGHLVGDAVLRAVAAKLGEPLRPGDTIARLGGDDFAILLSDLHRAEDAAAVARKLLDALAAPLAAAGNNLSVSASIGVAIYPEDGNDGAALLRNADTAMHRAKRDGGRAVRFFAEKLAVRARERLELEQALGRALELEQLSLHYQPQIDARTGRMSGAEALVRWQHPELGLVPPARFIAVAEETGLIVPIGEWVLREACGQTMRWRGEGLAPIRIGVNLSARQFWHGKLEPLVQAVLRESGLPPELLELEVTEGAVMRDAEETIATLGALKALGVTISVDDFGTGYSSLAYLRRFPIDRLKIDRSFVKDIADDPRAATLVQGIIGLAHGLGFRVVAEGVETTEQARFLRLFGCDELQGYFIARPLAAAAFRALLVEGRTWEPGSSGAG